MVRPEGRHQLQALRDIHKQGDFALVEASLLARCVARQDGRANTETEAVKLNNLSSNFTIFVRRNSTLVVVAKSFIKFGAKFGKELGLSFLAAKMVRIVEEIVSSDILTGTCLQTYQRYIRAA